MEPIIDLYSVFVEENQLVSFKKQHPEKVPQKQTTAISKVLVQRSQRNNNT